jgi:hypothetical protein
MSENDSASPDRSSGPMESAGWNPAQSGGELDDSDDGGANRGRSSEEWRSVDAPGVQLPWNRASK